MKRSFVAVVGMLSFVALTANCSSGPDTQTGSTEQEVRVCTKMPLYCPAGCEYQGNACPQQCHCPGYVQCGPTLKCGAKQECCTAGPINIDPALNNYMCLSAGTACPL